jgi:hypothetical protein
MALQPIVGSWSLFSFLVLYTVGTAPWTGASARLKAATYTQDNTKQNKRKQQQPVTLVFKRTKTIHSLHRSSTVIGHIYCLQNIIRW